MNKFVVATFTTRNGSTLTEDNIKDIIDLIKRGHSMKSVQKKYNIGYARLKYILSEFDIIPIKKHRFSPESVKKVDNKLDILMDNVMKVVNKSNEELEQILL